MKKWSAGVFAPPPEQGKPIEVFRTINYSEFCLQDDFVSSEDSIKYPDAGGTRMHNHGEKKSRRRAIHQGGGTDMQNGSGKMQKRVTNPTHYHKIHVKASRPKPIPIHRILSKVV